MSVNFKEYEFIVKHYSDDVFINQETITVPVPETDEPEIDKETAIDMLCLPLDEAVNQDWGYTYEYKLMDVH